jgi:hypothetical protein
MSRKQAKAQTFIERYLTGEARPEEIDDYVDTWHNSPDGLELHEFLGMSKEEYALWLRNPDALPDIARARKEGEGRISPQSNRSTTQIATRRPPDGRAQTRSSVERPHRRQ